MREYTTCTGSQSFLKDRKSKKLHPQKLHLKITSGNSVEGTGGNVGAVDTAQEKDRLLGSSVTGRPVTYKLTWQPGYQQTMTKHEREREKTVDP